MVAKLDIIVQSAIPASIGLNIRMKNKSNLVKGQPYQIKYVGFYGYDSYDGLGTYTGHIQNEDGEELFGFYIREYPGEDTWFPLNSIFSAD